MYGRNYYKRPFGKATRKPPGKMNNTEKKYADRLDEIKLTGEIITYYFERVKLKLADKCFYTPDFMLIMDDGSIVFDEVKGGFIMEDATIKFKMACEQFPNFKFRMWQYKNKKTGWIMIRENKDEKDS